MTNDESLPATCQLDRKRLSSIEGKLDQTLGKLETLTSIDGPIGKVQQEIIINRQVADAAHKRIDAHDIDIGSIGKRQWELVLKTAGGVLGGGGLMFVAAKVIEAFGTK